MKECLVHIGMHKTGSTSIQANLAGYDDGNVRYADFGIPNHSVPLGTLISANPLENSIHRRRGTTPAELEISLAYLTRQFSSELDREHSRIIFSAEGLTTLPRDAIEQLRARILSHQREARIIAYVRDPVSLAPSFFQQRVRGGMDKLSVPRPNYRDRFSKFIDVFGRDAVEFIKFDMSLFPDNSVVKDFFHRTEIKQDSVSEISMNASLSFAGTFLLFEFNRSGPKSLGSIEFDRARNSLVGALREHIEGPAFQFPQSIVGRSVHPPDLEWLKNNTGISFEKELDNAAKKKEVFDFDKLFRVDDETLQRLVGLLKGYGLSCGLNDSSLSMTSQLFTYFVDRAKKQIQTNSPEKQPENIENKPGQHANCFNAR